MIKKMILLTGIGVGILSFDWKPPYDFWEALIMLFGWILMLGPSFILVVAILNRLINISFTTKP